MVWGRLVKNSKQTNRIAGFTLVEFAIVMLMSGMILAAIIQAYKVYLADRYQREIYANMDVLNSSISVFASVQRRYPCPSDLSLPIDDPESGVENCAAAQALAVGDCTANGGICRVNGARTTPALGLVTPDPVYIGGFPYKTIRNFVSTNLQSVRLASSKDAIDPWGFQLTYAVSASQTDAGTYNTSYGAIDVQTEGGTSLIQPVGSAHFVLVSHGENHKGAFNALGRVAVACAAGTVDQENCDRTNATFIAGLRAMAAGAAYYDDVLLQRSFTMSELWRFGDTTSTIYNVNPGNVGVGTASPEQKLDINGNLRTSTVNASSLCDRGMENCWGPEKLGGSGMRCSTTAVPGRTRIMQGIRQAEVDPLCTEVSLPTVMANQKCANPGQYVVGFTASGSIICQVP